MILLILTFWIFLSLKYPWRTWKPHCLVFRNSNYVARACACFVYGQGKCFPELGASWWLWGAAGPPWPPWACFCYGPEPSQMLPRAYLHCGGLTWALVFFQTCYSCLGREWSLFGAVDLSWILWAYSVPQRLLSLSELGTQCCISSPGEGRGLPGLHDNICCKWRKQS